MDKPSLLRACFAFASVKSDRTKLANCAVCDNPRDAHDAAEPERIVSAAQAFHSRRGMLQHALGTLTENKPNVVEQTFSPNDALRAANAIIARLGNDVEIDWSRDPLSERERELRAAMIRRAEIDGTTGSSLTGPQWVLLNLSCLAHGSRVRINGDLWRAHKKWSALDADDTADRRRAQIEQAKRDVENGWIEGERL